MPEHEINTITENETTTNHIPKYKVILHDDDKTSMWFVTEILKIVFNKDPKSAEQIMMEVHETGAAVAGIYPLESAETRQDMCIRMAESNKYPFKVTIEPDN